MSRWLRLSGQNFWKLSMRFDLSRTSVYGWLGSSCLHLLLGLVLWLPRPDHEAVSAQPRRDVLQLRFQEKTKAKVKDVVKVKARVDRIAGLRSRVKPELHAVPALPSLPSIAQSELEGESVHPSASDPTPAGFAAPTTAPSETYLQNLREQIRAQQHYPYAARRLGLEGVVSLSFTIDHLGRLSELRPEDSDAPELLKEAAERAVRRAAPFAPPGEILSLRIKLLYQLKAAKNLELSSSQLELAVGRESPAGP